MSSAAQTSRFLKPTPAGCFHAVESSNGSRERAALLSLLRRTTSTTLPALASVDSAQAALVPDLIAAGFIEHSGAAESLPSVNLTDLLPSLLPRLSQRGRVVLTESRQGLFLDYVGVSQDQAEELAVLASALRSIADQRSPLLSDQLSIHSRAFGILDPAGNSEIGFWPLHISDNVFTLTILGIPCFNVEAFRVLVWALVERYGQTPTVPEP